MTHAPSVLDERVVVTRISLSTVHNDPDQLVVDLIAVGRYGRRAHHFYWTPGNYKKWEHKVLGEILWIANELLIKQLHYISSLW